MSLGLVLPFVYRHDAIAAVSRFAAKGGAVVCLDCPRMELQPA